MSIFAFPSGGSSDMELIYENTLTSTSNSIDTGTLPTGYKAFRIYTSVRSTTFNAWNSFFKIGYNGDTNSDNYTATITRLYSTNGQLGQNIVPGTTVGWACGQNNSITTFAFTVLDIMQPESTIKRKFVTGQAYGSRHFSTSSNLNATLVISQLYEPTTPITSIQFFGTNFIAGCSFRVYGIK